MGKSVFVVEGSDGSYSDRTTWLVAAFTTLAAAQAFADKCRAEEMRVTAERRKVEERFEAKREKAGVDVSIWRDMGEDRKAVWLRIAKQEESALKKVPVNRYDPTESGGRDAGYGVEEVPLFDTTAASGDENRAERGQGAEGDQGGDRG